MDARVFKVLTYRYWREGGLGIVRPGFNVYFGWHAPSRGFRFGFAKYMRGFRVDIGCFTISGTIDPALWFIRTAKCSKCKRLWPAETRSPQPGDPAWENIPLAERRFSGQWLNEVDTFVDGVVTYKPYKWIGPCCELNMSGMFDYDGDEEGYDEDDYDW